MGVSENFLVLLSYNYAEMAIVEWGEKGLDAE